MTDSEAGGTDWKAGGELVTVIAIVYGLLKKPSFTYTQTLELPTSVKVGVMSNMLGGVKVTKPGPPADKPIVVG